MRTSLLGCLLLAAVLMLAACAPVITQSFSLVERAPDDPLVDLAPEGDSIGDLLVFSNEIYDEANQDQLGTNSGFCIRTRVGVFWECFITFALEDGNLTVQGIFYDDGRDSTFTVNGGTGNYKGAQGEAVLTIRNEDFTEFGFAFDIVRPGPSAAGLPMAQ